VEIKPIFQTKNGSLYNGDSFDILRNREFFKKYKNKIKLVFTSPPFILQQKKSYGNLNGQEYIHWIKELGKILSPYLHKKASVVIEIGNAWEKGSPTQSTVPYEALIAFKESCNLVLCQELTYFNPAKLPTPAEWVTIRRIRLKDSTSKVWWMSRTPFPYADNRNVLKPYSDSMIKLLQKKKYNHGRRPSDHNINERSFLSDNKGAIASNLLSVSNTNSSDKYLKFCKNNQIKTHPARMPTAIAEFFISFLTRKGDLVFDPFAGSNTTGEAAEKLQRHWMSIELSKEFAFSSFARFM
jgi:site-specific DNA-methyltransferase (cytosine-N4-specific)